MRIFCFIDDLGAGGAQRQLVLLSAGFRKLGHQVEIGVHAEAHFYDSFLQDRGIPIHRITGVNKWQRIRQLRALLVDLSPDRVIAFLLGIELVVSHRVPEAGLPARSTTALRQECRILTGLNFAADGSINRALTRSVRGQ